MYRRIIFKMISVIVAAAIIYIAGWYQASADLSASGRSIGRELPAELLYQELESHKESLEDTVAELRDELAGKKNELAGLNQELSKLETQYNMLLAESKRIAERLEYLKGVQ